MASFNPVLALYLFPEVTVGSNVCTVEAASNAYYASNAFPEYGVVAALQQQGKYPGPSFDGHLYLLQNIGAVDVCGVNGAVRQAMALCGGSSNALDQQSTYLECINQPVLLTACNQFEFSDPLYAVSPSNVQVGSKVQIVRNGYYSLYSTVTSLSPPADNSNSMFTVSNAFFPVTDPTASYVLQSVYVTDVQRVGTINYVRNAIAATQSNIALDQASNVAGGVYDTGFDYALYQTLYTDAVTFSPEQCYFQWTQLRAEGTYRISRASDILNIASPIVDFYESVVCHSNLTVEGEFCMSNQANQPTFITYISTDALGTAATACNNALITELAIKTYVDDKFSSNTTFTAPVVLFDSNVTILGELTACNDATIGGRLSAAETYTTSDRRLKTNITPIDDAMARLAGIHGYTFDKGATLQMGLIAQEVQRSAPEAVHSNSEGFLSVAYGNLAALFVEAIRCLDARLAALEAA